ncbi:MAG: M56 family metallopeptidase [Prevotellaceae bacterium]|nr:M56 family metallopeptidase [Prevotellaceae bacterium]
MGTLLVYIIKSGICLSVLYLFYKLLLSNETFHKFNRAALLGILFLSMTLPLIEISFNKQAIEMPENVMLMLQSSWVSANVANTGLTQQPEITEITWLHIMLLIYIVGIIFLPVRNIYSIIRLCVLIKNGKKQKIEKNITLVIHDNNIAPFSWFKYIVISEKDFNENGNEIIAHEKAHILKRHSIDLMLCHIYNIIQWINPVAWLFKHELQNIHEYEADEAVINKGINTKQYQMLLIQKAVGAKLFALANNFNKSKLKKRIKMMSKQKSNPYSRLKYLYVLPLLAVFVTAFANPQMKDEMEKISAISISDFIAQNETDENENSTAADSISKSYVYQIQINDSVDSTTKATAVISKSINNQDTIIIYLTQDNVGKSDVDSLDNPTIVLDGEIIENVSDVDENDIESVSVFKNAASAGKDSNDKTHSFVLITTKTDKDGNKKPTTKVYTKTFSRSGKTSKTSSNIFITCDTISLNKHNNQMRIMFENSNLDSLTNAVFAKLPDMDSIKKTWSYGFKSWNTDSMKVWSSDIKLWNIDSLKKMNFNFNFNLDSVKVNYDDLFYTKPLVIVDGKEMKLDDFEKTSSNAEIIGTISVLKGEAATKQYGTKARNGVIIIDSKKPSDKNKNKIFNNNSKQ